MRANVLNFLCLLSFICVFIPAPAKAIAPAGQFLLAVDRPFYTIGDTSFVAHVNNLSATNMGFNVFGYVGVAQRFTPKLTLTLLGGSWFTRDGASTIASCWLDYRELLRGVGVFVEGDFYFPTNGEALHALKTGYAYVQLEWMKDENFGLGFITEHVAHFDGSLLFDERAVGPAILTKKVTFWLGADIAPELPENVIFLRMMLFP